jgi:hypothetical protein
MGSAPKLGSPGPRGGMDAMYRRRHPSIDVSDKSPALTGMLSELNRIELKARLVFPC